MESLLFAILGKQTEMIKHYDLSDPSVQDELKALENDFMHVIDYGELPPSSTGRWT